VLFDKICRHNGIIHRLTAPASPNQNGKVERFHGTFRPGFLDITGPFASVPEAQAAVDTWVGHYNADRPHQALDEKVPVTPAERFTPAPARQRDLISLWLPANLGSANTAAPGPSSGAGPAAPASHKQWNGGPVEFDRVVPASGNMIVCQRQFWMGPHRAGMMAPDLGRLRPDPRPGRRHPDQDRPLPPVRGRSGPAHRPGSGAGRSLAAATGRRW
jgi:hypothetical protein